MKQSEMQQQHRRLPKQREVFLFFFGATTKLCLRRGGIQAPHLPYIWGARCGKVRLVRTE